MITPFEYAEKYQTELGQQTALFMQAALMAKVDDRWSMLFAIPNGGLRDKVTASRLKMSGVRAGVPDVFLSVPIGRFHGLYVEVKAKNGKFTDGQVEFFQKAHALGYSCRAAWGMPQAYGEICNYLAGW